MTLKDKQKNRHEEYFKRLEKQFLEYLANQNMPDWKISNTLAR